MEKIRVLNISFDNVTLENALRHTMDMLKNKKKGFIVTPNSEIVYECLKNGELCSAVMQASLVLPDGIGVVYASKLYKTPLIGKVAGIDFALKLCERLQNTGYRLYLLGAKPGVAEKAADNLRRIYPGLDICGVKDGYFANDAEAVYSINKAAADVVFVCLGSPKQEFFMQQNLDKISASLLIGLGGSLDVFSGEVRRAPGLFIRFGLEWFYRLLKEPKRIFRMRKLPLFLLAAKKDSMKGAKASK